jgi:peptidyl-prolyl cis-trans isomerase SurA
MRYLFTLLVLCLVAAQPAWAQRVNQLPPQQTSPAVAPAVRAPAAAPAAPTIAPVATTPAPEQQGPVHDRIAAVVNDNVISTADIDARLRLALISSGLPNTAEVIQHLLPQILRGLVDEQLQLQEAKRLDISISKEDIDKALDRIAHENNMQGDMRDYVREHGASPQALEQQVRATLAWSRVVQRELRPRVEVGDDEVDAAIQRVRANAGKQEFLVSEIFLAVDNPKDEDEVKQLAEKLVEQLKSGANFGAVARQFSQSTGAASGGDIGWIQEGQLAPELNHALTGMQPKEVAGPIRSASGYHILGLRDKRTITLGGDAQNQDITLSLQQAFRPFTAGMERDALLQDANRLRSSINDCTNLQGQLAQKFPDWHWQNMGDVKPDKIPAWLSEKVRDVQPGKGSEPLATDKGALIVFVCGRHVPDGNVDREAIMSGIGTEKLELQARRLMRDLRRAAYLDIRLGSNPS